MKPEIKVKQEMYFFDKERLIEKDRSGNAKFLGKKKPLGYKLHRILTTVQKIRKVFDAIEKCELSPYPGPKVGALYVESEGVAQIENTLRTNANLEIGLHFNTIELEVKVLDYYQCIIEFEKDYLRLSTKKFINLSNILDTRLTSSTSQQLYTLLEVLLMN